MNLREPTGVCEVEMTSFLVLSNALWVEALETVWAALFPAVTEFFSLSRSSWS